MAKGTSAQQLKTLQAEIKSLKAENVRLKNGQGISNKQKRKPIKATLSLVLITFSVIFILIANIFLWAGNTIFNTEKYVKAVNPIIEQPAVQTAIAQIATEKIFENIDVENYVSEALPPRISFLAPQLTQQLNNQVQNGFSTALASDRFQDTWQQVNQKQHERILSFIKNYDGDGTISVSEIYSQLQTRFTDTPLSFLSGKQLPERVGTITVVEAPRLPLYHDIATNLNLIRWLSLALAAATLFGGMWLSKNRRKAYYFFAGGVALAMISTLIALRVAQATAAQSVQSQFAEAAQISAEILTQGLRVQSILIFCFAVLTSIIVWISGGSRRATQVKGWFRSGVSAPLHELVFASRAAKVTSFVHTYKRQLEWVVFIAATLILLYTRLSLASMLRWLGGLIIAIALLEFVGAEALPKKTPKK